MGRVSVHAPGSSAAATASGTTPIERTAPNAIFVFIRIASPVDPDAQPKTDAAQVLSRELRVEHVHEPALQRHAPLEVRIEAALDVEGVALVAVEQPAALR